MGLPLWVPGGRCDILLWFRGSKLKPIPARLWWLPFRSGGRLKLFPFLFVAALLLHWRDAESMTPMLVVRLLLWLMGVLGEGLRKLGRSPCFLAVSVSVRRRYFVAFHFRFYCRFCSLPLPFSFYLWRIRFRIRFRLLPFPLPFCCGGVANFGRLAALV
jgi:hypothetical protein